MPPRIPPRPGPPPPLPPPPPGAAAPAGAARRGRHAQLAVPHGPERGVLGHTRGLVLGCLFLLLGGRPCGERLALGATATAPAAAAPAAAAAGAALGVQAGLELAPPRPRRPPP